MTDTVPRREIDVFDEMDHTFGTLFHRGWLRPYRDVWPQWARVDEAFDLGTPRMDVIDRDEEILVRAEVPDVDKKDLDVDLTGRHLRIQGERQQAPGLQK